MYQTHTRSITHSTTSAHNHLASSIEADRFSSDFQAGIFDVQKELVRLCLVKYLVAEGAFCLTPSRLVLSKI